MANEMISMVQQTVAAQTEQANAIVQQITAATQDSGKLVHDVRTDESATDENVKAFQEWYEKANAAIEAKVAEINAYIKANLLPESGANVDVDALKEEYKTLRQSIKTATAFVATLPGYSADDFKVPELKNLRGGTSGTTGSGGKRPRLESIWVNGKLIEKVTQDKQGNDVHTSNFTLAAAEISKAAKSKVEVKDLQAAAFEAAGTDDLSTLAGTVFEFSFSAGEGENAQNFDVTVQPKNPEAAADTAEAATPAE
jgi:hypothetical protein